MFELMARLAWDWEWKGWSGVGSLATVVGVLVGLLTVAVAWRTFKAQQREKREEQARLVFVRPEREGGPMESVSHDETHEWVIAVYNRSPLPIYDVRLADHFAFVENDHDLRSVFIDCLVAGERAEVVPNPCSAKFRRISCSIAFTDSQGRAWKRGNDGGLKAIHGTDYMDDAWPPPPGGSWDARLG